MVAQRPSVFGFRIPKTVYVPAIICICTYLVFEIAVSLLYLADVIERPASIWLFEDSGRTVQFDAVRGYRLTATPDPGQEWIIEDIVRAVKTMNVPVMVVHVPSREELLGDKADAAPSVDARLFASLLDARLVDGKQAFAGRSQEEIRALRLPYDAHWAQNGSNSFGQYMAGVLAVWP